MMRMRGWALGLCVCMMAGAARADDEIERLGANGRISRVRGKINAETPTKVEISTSAGDEEVPVNEIANVRYDQQPTELAQVRAQLEQQRYEEALETLKTLYERVKDTRQEFLKASLLFQVFRTQFQIAKADESKIDAALATEAEFRAAFPRSRHDFKLDEMTGELCLAKRDFARAKKAFANLRGADWPGYREKAMVYEGLALMEEGDVTGALGNFDIVLATTDSPATRDQRLAAQVFKAEAMLKTAKDAKKGAEIEKLLRAALAATPADNRLVKALGHNALGDALRLQKKPPMEILMEGYFYNVVLYNEDGRQLARALYQSQELFKQLGQTDRQETYARELRTKFPDSPWTKKLPAGVGAAGGTGGAAAGGADSN
jgi:tetratricopeptide (TPR) repeat protein